MSSDSKSRRRAEPDQKPAKPAATRRQPSAPSKAAVRTNRATVRARRHGTLGLDSEQSARMLLFGATALVLIAAAAFIAIGYYYSVIKPRGRTVLQMDDQKVSYAAMKRRMANEYFTNTSYQNQQAVFSVPVIAYQNLRDELTLISRAESEQGVTADDNEVTQQLKTKVGVAADADDQTFAEKYRTVLAASHLHEAEYRRIARAAVLEQKVKAKLNTTTPANVPEAKLEVITTNDAAQAQSAIDRVKFGEPWATVATAVSVETDAKTSGGVKDYTFESAMPKAYATFAFSAPIGQISAPQQDPSGVGPFYVVRVVDRADKPLTDAQKPSYQSRQYRQWLEDTQSGMLIVDKWTTDSTAQSDAIQPLIDDLAAKAKLQQQQQRQPQPTLALPTAGPTDAATPTGETPVSSAPSGGEATPVATAPANGQ